MKTLLPIILSALAHASHCEAAILTFTDRDQFISAISAFTTYTEESFPPPTSSFSGTPVQYNSQGISYTVNAPGGLYFYPVVGNGSLSTSTPGDQLTIGNFSSGVDAVGAYFFFDNGSGGLNLDASGVVTGSNGIDVQIADVLAPATRTNFLGFISTRGDLVSVTFAPSGSAWVNIDDLLVAKVLVPSSLALLAAGLLAAGAIRRFRRA